MSQTAERTPLDRGRATEVLLARLRRRADVPGERPLVAAVAPWTGEVLSRLPHGTADDVRAAVARARTAQRDWAALPPRTRAQVLLRLSGLVLARRAEGMDLVQLENGKARRHAFEEVADAAGVARWTGRAAPSLLAPSRRRGAMPGATSVRVHSHPVGVVGVISPWNYPLTLAVSDAVAALAAGNAVVLIPDAQTTLSALWVASLLDEAGLPAGLLQVVPGRGAELGTPLIEAVDHVAFTGSTAVGRLVAEQCARRLIGCSLELGGKNAMVVLADTDVDTAVEGAVRACFSSTGQLCISAERLYVEEPLAAAFTERFAARVRAMRVGCGFDWELEMGSLVGRRQLDTVQRHVDDAVARGAVVVAGGHPLPDHGPFVYAPTVLADVPSDALCFAEETFGPVVAVTPVASADEAVARANDSRYGLNASVWGADVARAQAVARRIHAGTVNVNEAYAAAWGSYDAPMGGIGDSGLGRRHGREGLLQFTEQQTVATQRFVPLGPSPGMSAERYAELLTRALGVTRRLPFLR